MLVDLVVLRPAFARRIAVLLIGFRKDIAPT
jgi:hypothetical protein